MLAHAPLSRRRPRYDPLAVLAYISAYQQRHRQRSPSQRRIQTALGISAPSVVHNILLRLQRAGLLTTRRYGRGLRVDHVLTTQGQAALAQWQSAQAARDAPVPLHEKDRCA